MLILNRHDVESLLTIQAAISAVEEGFAQLSAGNVVMPQRLVTPISHYNGLHLSMPAFVDGAESALIVKIITVYGDNPAQYGLPTIQGVLLLYEATTGRLLAMIEAEHLTALRTGAASGVAAKHLARPDAATLLLFGAGALAPCQLAAVCAVRPIQRIFVISRSGAKDSAFCQQMRRELSIEVTAMRNAEEAVRQADIICTATTATTPLFDGQWLKPGVHINGVGSYTAKMRELDSTAIRRARLFVDRRQAAQSEAGDILIPLAEGVITLEHVAGELGEVINGDVVGRSSSEQITLFKSVGTAMQDAVTAALAYKRAREQGAGQEAAL